MTQEQLADATGLTSVHVNRTIKSLEADGLIERNSARAIGIGDWRKLAEVGDFQSTYLHLRRSVTAAGNPLENFEDASVRFRPKADTNVAPLRPLQVAFAELTATGICLQGTIGGASAYCR